MNIRLGLLALLFAANVSSAPNYPTQFNDMTTAAAMGYCLAKHPYQSIYRGRYTADGFEIAQPPGIVGAVRRNFIFDRTTNTLDEGEANTCTKACAEFGKASLIPGGGVPLHQRIFNGVSTVTITSGIGDLVVGEIPDFDRVFLNNVVAGMTARPGTFHESHVARADFCCCQAKQ